MKIVTSEQMRALERRSAQAGVSVDMLMENAGMAVAEKVREFLGEVGGSRIIVLVGPGNNGGDGLVCARHLAQWGAKVQLYLCAPRKEPDPKLRLCQEAGIPTTKGWKDQELSALNEMLFNSRLVVDAILGTGRSRPLEGTIEAVMERLRQVRHADRELNLLALDLPTGLDCDTGAVDPACVSADVTVTLGNPKVGLFAFPGADYVGELITVDIGIPEGLDSDISLELLTPEWARQVLPSRPASAHKGTFGRVMVVAGSINYVGAAYMAAAAATRVGAGLVTLATGKSLIPAIAAKAVEVTYVPLPESSTGVVDRTAAKDLLPQLGGYTTLLAGCGLGQHPSVLELLHDLLFSEAVARLQGIVLDADGLNNLVKLPGWWQHLPQGKCVLTPHPGEMERLLGRPAAEIQKDRVGAAQGAASTWGQVVVLKGAFTVIAGPEGRQMLCPIASAALATAGTGDVLAGAIAGLLAQGLSPFDAAAAGVYLHGLAGQLASQELGAAGVIASDLLPLLPKVIKSLKSGEDPSPS